MDMYIVSPFGISIYVHALLLLFLFIASVNVNLVVPLPKVPRGWGGLWHYLIEAGQVEPSHCSSHENNKWVL
eukprot:SAG31_NODE_63_length_28659_cov_23.074685_14_plen_72_part_00